MHNMQYVVKHMDFILSRLYLYKQMAQRLLNMLSNRFSLVHIFGLTQFHSQLAYFTSFPSFWRKNQKIGGMNDRSI